MKSLKTFLLIAACLSTVTIIGGAVYEHLTVVPQWAAAPPASLSMFQGKYGLNTAPFWKMIHPVSLLLMVAALIANWKTARRKYILIPIAGYVLVLIITFVYFVPELLSIIQTPYQDAVDKGLVERAGRWEALSLVRLAFLIPMFGVLLLSLTKGNEKAV
jgi:hypothetical protein